MTTELTLPAASEHVAGLRAHRRTNAKQQIELFLLLVGDDGQPIDELVTHVIDPDDPHYTDTCWIDRTLGLLDGICGYSNAGGALMEVDVIARLLKQKYSAASIWTVSVPLTAYANINYTLYALPLAGRLGGHDNMVVLDGIFSYVADTEEMLDSLAEFQRMRPAAHALQDCDNYVG